MDVSSDLGSHRLEHWYCGSVDARCRYFMESSVILLCEARGRSWLTATSEKIRFPDSESGSADRTKTRNGLGNGSIKLRLVALQVVGRAFMVVV